MKVMVMVKVLATVRGEGTSDTSEACQVKVAHSHSHSPSHSPSHSQPHSHLHATVQVQAKACGLVLAFVAEIGGASHLV